VRRVLASLALIAASAAAYGNTWSDLWLNSEQQAQRLLASGNAADAAPHFNDPRRRAYAELQAGRYADAARRLSPFSDVDSEYNRGNALAHSGDLKGALEAYDAALAQQPTNTDARHNREIVARVLQNTSQRRKDEPNKTSPQTDSGSNDSGSNREQRAPRTSRGNPSSEPPHSGADHSNHPAPSDTSSEKSGAGASRGAPSAALQKDSAAKEPPSAGTASGESRSGDDHKSATRMGSAADRQQQPVASSELRGSPKQTESAVSNARLTQNEQTLSLDQWLRRIPDDPAQLLRRKFLLEHMLRQGPDSQ
jgi:Ca-activated chloride channel homolog